jgi:hypothetical protein
VVGLVLSFVNSWTAAAMADDVELGHATWSYGDQEDVEV